MSHSRPSIVTGLGGAGTDMSNDSRDSLEAGEVKAKALARIEAHVVKVFRMRRRFYRPGVPAGTFAKHLQHYGDETPCYLLRDDPPLGYIWSR
jgi:hypothetical protein